MKRTSMSGGSGAALMKKGLVLLWWGVVLLAGGTSSVLGDPAPEAETLRLKNELRESRKARLADLESYVRAEMFPHNHDVKGRREPYLIDRHGRLCAVAYLVASSEIPDFKYGDFSYANNRAQWGYSSGGNLYGDVDGNLPGPEEMARLKEAEKRQAAIEKSYREFAAKLLEYASGNNHLRMMEVRDGALMDWVLKSGLTLEECALIQPGYTYLSCNDCLAGSEDGEGGAFNRPPGDTETKHQIRAVSFGQPTLESVEIARVDGERIRKHLRSVLAKLQVDTEQSLDLAVKRLKARPPGGKAGENVKPQAPDVDPPASKPAL